jgi:hypothetical protein
MTNILEITYHLRLKTPHFSGWIHLHLQKKWGTLVSISETLYKWDTLDIIKKNSCKINVINLKRVRINVFKTQAKEGINFKACTDLHSV